MNGKPLYNPVSGSKTIVANGRNDKLERIWKPAVVQFRHYSISFLEELRKTTSVGTAGVQDEIQIMMS